MDVPELRAAAVQHDCHRRDRHDRHGALLHSRRLCLLPLRLPGKAIFFVLLMGTIILPSEVTLIPTYIIFFQIGWVGLAAADRTALFRQRLECLPAAPVHHGHPTANWMKPP